MAPEHDPAHQISQSTPESKPTSSFGSDSAPKLALGTRILGDFELRFLPGASKEQNAIAIAERQRRRVRRDQLRDAGWSPGMIHRAVGDGTFKAVERAVFLHGSPPRPDPLGPETEALLRVGVDSLLIGTSALAALRLIHRPAGPIHVHCPRRVPHREGVRVHHLRSLSTSERTREEQLPVTTVARALLDAAPHLDDSQLSKAFDEARHRTLTSPSKLREVLERHPRHPGVAKLRPLADPGRRSQRTESQLQARALALIAEAGLPTPITEANLLDLGYRADLYWPDAHLAVEVDSFEFHGVDEANFNRDRVKDRLWAEHGIDTVRWSEADILHRSHQILVQLALRRQERRDRIATDRAKVD